MLGNFHLTKIALGCAGSYLIGSGIEDSLVETTVFGQNVVKSVISGTHYYRSFAGILIISEAVENLILEAFMRPIYLTILMRS